MSSNLKFGILFVAIGATWFIFSIVFKNTGRFFDNYKDVIVKSKKPFNEIQIISHIIGSLIIISMGFLCIYKIIPNYNIILSPLFLSLTVFITKKIGVARGYIELKPNKN